MKMIEMGDIVSVYWENIGCETKVKVLYIPCETGDSWILEKLDGTIMHVNSFCVMYKEDSNV